MPNEQAILYLVANFLFAALLVMPAIIAALANRVGLRLAAGLAVALGLVASLVVEGTSLGSLSVALGAGVGIGGLGLALWYYGRQTMPLGKLFAGLMALLFVGTVGQYLALQLAGGHGLLSIGHAWLGQLYASFDQYLDMLATQVGAEGLGNLNALRAQRFTFVWTLFRLLPALTTFGVAGLVLVNVLLARRLFPALAAHRFNRWRAPDTAIWAVLIPGLGLLPFLIFQMLDRDRSAVTLLFYVSLNVVLIALVPYIMQGMGVLSFFMKRWRVPRLLRGLTYFLIFSQGLVAVVPALGMMEFWTDWRGRTLARDDAVEKGKDENQEF